MILSFALASSLLITQHFTCFPVDSQSNDRVVISLKLKDSRTVPAAGTLYFTEGVDAEGRQTNSGVLPIALDTGNAAPSDGDEVSYSGEDESSRYRITLPTSTIGRASKHIQIRVMLENADRSGHLEFEMSCYSSLAGSEAPRYR